MALNFKQKLILKNTVIIFGLVVFVGGVYFLTGGANLYQSSLLNSSTGTVNTQVTVDFGKNPPETINVDENFAPVVEPINGSGTLNETGLVLPIETGSILTNTGITNIQSGNLIINTSTGETVHGSAPVENNIAIVDKPVETTTGSNISEDVGINTPTNITYKDEFSEEINYHTASPSTLTTYSGENNQVEKIDKINKNPQTGTGEFMLIMIAAILGIVWRMRKVR